jgi:putative sporulation protein YtxC
MHITFQCASDTDYVFNLLSSLTGKSSEIIKMNIEEPTTLYIEFLKENKESLHTYIVPALSQFILKVKEPQYIRHFLYTMFYYEDETEQLQIIQIVQSLVSDDEEHLHPSLKDGYPREEIIKRALSMFLSTNVQFSFEAFLTFRLKDYLLRLQDYIEVAIDEYKLEQDYQDFIESLRKYIAAKTSTIKLVHAVQEDDHFAFYDEAFNRFTIDIEMEEHFISDYGFEVDKELIAPLLLLCPNSINLYSVDLDHGIIQTVVSIFQERVSVYPYDQFKEKNSSRS